MKFGTWDLAAPPFERVIKNTAMAEQNGFDFICWYDQMNDYHPTSIHTPDITPLAAAFPRLDDFFEMAPVISCAAQETSTIEFLYGPIDAVRRPPSLLAQTMLTLDHATRGRTITALGAGEVKQMRPYGVSRKGVGDKLWDMVHIISKHFATDQPISYEGRYWKLDRALLSLEPFGPRQPRFWIAGGGAEVMHLVGTFADGWLTSAPGFSYDDPDLFRRQVDQIRQAAVAAGRDPDTIDICLLAFYMTSESPQELDKLKDHPIIRWVTMMANLNTNWWYSRLGLDHPFGDNWMYTARLVPYWFSREEALDICQRTPREAVDHIFFTGTAGQIVDRITPYLDAGVTHAFLVDWAPMAGGGDVGAADEVNAIIRNRTA